MTSQTSSRRHALRGAIAFLLSTALIACDSIPLAPLSRNVSPDFPIVQRLDSAVTCVDGAIDDNELPCILGRSDGTIVDPLTLQTTCSCFAAGAR